ncbi:putative DNA-binding protein [Burkholderia pseudomallei]|nr:putative DNA-binding protein [Burkholderia pseudomallei]VBI35034.1 putative DNA-binding protein [Burkholderia pseudomallei]
MMSGVLAPEGCEEMPDDGVGLDGEPLINGGHSRFHLARRIMREWREWAREAAGEGEAAPTKMAPHQFIDWFEREEIESEWLPLFIDVIVGKPSAGQVDFIPVQVAEYAARSMTIVDSIRAVLDGATPSTGPASVPEALASPRRSAARVPMPIPENRDFLSTEEFAAVMAVDPQSIRKRYSSEGSYHGVRPTKLANRRVLWPVDAVRQLRNGGIVAKE